MNLHGMPHNEGGETVPSSSPAPGEGKAPTTAPDYAQEAAPVNPGGSGDARACVEILNREGLNDPHDTWSRVECIAKLRRLETAIEAIRETCSHYADGSPDASPRDWFANMILGIIERDGK